MSQAQPARAAPFWPGRFGATMIALALTLLVVVAVLVAVTRLIAARVEAAMPPQGRFVTADGTRLHVIERGAASSTPQATLVFIHGASSNATEPLTVLSPVLNAGYRLISIDRPGHGWSERSDDAQSAPDRQARAIAAVLDQMAVTRPIIVGHSFGGIVALSLALERPDLVAGLLLLSPVSHPWPGGIAWYYTAAASNMTGWLFSQTLAIPAAAALLEPGARSVFAPQEMPPHYLDDARIRLLLRPHVFRANAQDVAGLMAYVEAQQARYGTIKAPTTIITGDTDSIVSPSIHSLSLKRQVSDARLIVMPNVGHQPQFADPDLVAAEIDRLVARLSPGMAAEPAAAVRAP